MLEINPMQRRLQHSIACMALLAGCATAAPPHSSASSSTAPRTSIGSPSIRADVEPAREGTSNDIANAAVLSTADLAHRSLQVVLTGAVVVIEGVRTLAESLPRAPGAVAHMIEGAVCGIERSPVLAVPVIALHQGGDPIVLVVDMPLVDRSTRIEMSARANGVVDVAMLTGGWFACETSAASITVDGRPLSALADAPSSLAANVEWRSNDQSHARTEPDAGMPWLFPSITSAPVVAAPARSATEPVALDPTSVAASSVASEPAPPPALHGSGIVLRTTLPSRFIADLLSARTLTIRVGERTTGFAPREHEAIRAFVATLGA